ncbi:MAG: Molybdenum transport system permease protein ModB [Anaerolineales bacterium]|nr:Molybdenum transport system permease protein ModB [Anaerolineales bacterium]
MAELPLEYTAADRPVPAWRTSLRRRYREFKLIGQDPILSMGLFLVGIFVFLFVFFPLLRVIWQGFFDPTTGAFSLKYFAQYVDPYYQAYHFQVLRDTITMGVMTAAGGTILGFIFAYTMVRCAVPYPRLLHYLTLLPTISPPFAIAIASILLFGRSGLITKDLLGIRFSPGVNDIYGLDGLVFVQIITYFSVAYLIIRGMLERLDPAMEEAALSLGASKFHIFHTVTLPLLIPGLAGAFLLLFVEALADLGNPLLISGNTSVLSAEIYLAINGQYDQQKGAALSLVLLIPTLTVFLLQRYWVSRRSYVSVTGKPTGGQLTVKEPYIRWSFITFTTLTLILILSLYTSILLGSFTRLWGIDYTPDLSHYGKALGRGLNAVLSTTFLSVIATPIAGLIGMVIAFLVVRKAFSGKEALDFTSNLGGAVPGTILGIGYIIAFIKAPTFVVGLLYALLAGYLVSRTVSNNRRRILIVATGTLIGYGLSRLPGVIFIDSFWRYLLALGTLVLAGAMFPFVPPARRRGAILALVIMAGGLIVYNLSPLLTEPLATWGRAMSNRTLSRLTIKTASAIRVFTQPTMTILGYTYLVAALFVVTRARERARAWIVTALLALCAALVFQGKPLALVGTPYIVIAAYAVRSTSATVRAGIAALQQIDPAIEEASTSLGADTQQTFRNITLPLILPAFIAGLIFAFARHMTSLSAIIFLTTAEWPILTVWILSEVEQGGMSTAAAYSMILIFIVLAAIGLMYAFVGQAFGAREGIDLTLGGG